MEYQVAVFYWSALQDGYMLNSDMPMIIKLIKSQRYPTQKPIRVNYIGANSSDDEIYYLLNDPEAKAEYQKQLMLDNINQAGMPSVKQKRRM